MKSLISLIRTLTKLLRVDVNMFDVSRNVFVKRLEVAMSSAVVSATLTPMNSSK